MSCTIKPVTQTAEVDVKKASIRGVPFPSVVACGDIKSTVPMIIKIMKLITIAIPGFEV